MVRQPVLYPAVYPWYVALAAADVFVTWFILTMGQVGIGEMTFEGREVNVVADSLWRCFGEAGLVALKFGSVLFVLVACEIVGRHKLHLGRRLAEWAAALNAVPVILGVTQLSALAIVAQG